MDLSTMSEADRRQSTRPSRRACQDADDGGPPDFHGVGTGGLPEATTAKPQWAQDILDALQEVQPAPEAPVQPSAHPRSIATGTATREATAPMVDASLKDGANEITMQQDDRGTIRGSMWSDDTRSDGLQEENDP